MSYDCFGFKGYSHDAPGRLEIHFGQVEAAFGASLRLEASTGVLDHGTALLYQSTEICLADLHWTEEMFAIGSHADQRVCSLNAGTLIASRNTDEFRCDITVSEDDTPAGFIVVHAPWIRPRDVDIFRRYYVALRYFKGARAMREESIPENSPDRDDIVARVFGCSIHDPVVAALDRLKVLGSLAPVTDLNALDPSSYVADGVGVYSVRSIVTFLNEVSSD